MSLENSRNGQKIEVMPIHLSHEDELNYGGIIARTFAYIGATPQSGYTPGQKIQFQLPRELLDLRCATFQFTLSNTPGAGSTYNRFNNGIVSIINRMTIQAGSKTLLDVNYYNVVSQLDSLTRDTDWFTTVGIYTAGYGTTVIRGTFFNEPNRTYSLQLSNFSNEFMHSIVVAQKLGVPIIINLYLEDANNCIESDGTGATYVLNNARLYYASMVPSDEWDRRFTEKLNSSLLPTFTYASYEVQEDSSTFVTGITQASKILNFKYSDLTGINLCFRPAANIGQFGQNDKLNNFIFPQISSAWIKIGGMSYPVDQETSSSNRFVSMTEYYNLSQIKRPLAFGNNWEGTFAIPGSFCCSFSFEKTPFEANDQRVISPGINTAIATSLTLNLTFSVALPADYVVDVMGRYNSTIVYNRNGSLSLYT